METMRIKAQQAKLAGQMLWLDRQVTQLQHQLGVDIFEVAFGFAAAQQAAAAASRSSFSEADHNSRYSNNGGSDEDEEEEEQGEWHAVPGLPPIFTAAVQDVQDLFAQRQAADDKRDALEGGNSGSGGGGTSSSWAATATRRAALAAEMAYLDREIYLRKQIFGAQVATELQIAERDDFLVSSSSANDGTKNNTNNNNNGNEQRRQQQQQQNEIICVLYRFQTAVRKIQQQRQAYQAEMDKLSGVGPTETANLVVPGADDDDDDADDHGDMNNNNNANDDDKDARFTVASPSTSEHQDHDNSTNNNNIIEDSRHSNHSSLQDEDLDL